jgi:hypothetical protein
LSVIVETEIFAVTVLDAGESSSFALFSALSGHIEGLVSCAESLPITVVMSRVSPGRLSPECGEWEVRLKVEETQKVKLR